MANKLSKRPYTKTLFEAFLDAATRYGASKIILDDADRQNLSYGKLKLASLVLGRRLVRNTNPNGAIGVLLPNVTALVVSILGINAFGRVSALFNFTAGERNLASATRTAQVTTVITSRRFIEAANLETVIAAIENAYDDDASNKTHAPTPKVDIVYLEDVRAKIGLVDKLLALLQGQMPLRPQRRANMSSLSPAVIIFTSGTEGAPKGVVLSNQNLVANAHQIITHAHGHLDDTDVMMNPLPMFHSYGLTAGTLMPLLYGIKVCLYPSPLHYREIPKYIKRTKATVLVATDTFLQGYARGAGDNDLDTVRLVVAGAEAVKTRTRELWKHAGTEILEGYGATECSPVIACNLPGDPTDGSVGAVLPDIEAKLEPVPDIIDGARLFVRGPNVMTGYMYANRPGQIEPPHDGWHDTGDIVTIANNRVTIKGRAKRFAKIGGEMVSLAAVEAMVASLWPEARHVVAAIANPKKGEQLILLTEQTGAERDLLLKHAQAQGFAELWIPKSIKFINEIPLLGSGKVDFSASQALAENAA